MYIPHHFFSESNKNFGKWAKRKFQIIILPNLFGLMLLLLVLIGHCMQYFDNIFVFQVEITIQLSLFPPTCKNKLQLLFFYLPKFKKISRINKFLVSLLLLITSNFHGDYKYLRLVNEWSWEAKIFETKWAIRMETIL